MSSDGLAGHQSIDARRPADQALGKRIVPQLNPAVRIWFYGIGAEGRIPDRIRPGHLLILLMVVYKCVASPFPEFAAACQSDNVPARAGNGDKFR